MPHNELAAETPLHVVHDELAAEELPQIVPHKGHGAEELLNLEHNELVAEELP